MANQPQDKDVLALVDKLDESVLLIGDLMLDLFTSGSVKRISPEAPIPVMKITSERAMAGGVGNVARNVTALGGKATLIAPMGVDEAACRLHRILNNEPGLAPMLHKCDRPTVTKTRYVASGQHLLRVDYEDIGPLNAATEDSIIQSIQAEIPRHASVVLSDYGKGCVSAAVVAATLAACRARNVPLFVDPKSKNFRIYSGATCITPNVTELENATGLPVTNDTEVIAACRTVQADASIDYVLATRSEDGMTLVCDGGQASHLPARRREVFDVSGAGDTVIATMALVIASGGSWTQAAYLANVAAGVVVSKLGTSTCTRLELAHELAEAQLSAKAKLCDRDQAATTSMHWSSLGLKVGFTNGCFDLLHPGHIQILERARSRCDRLIVGLNSDDSVRRNKGPSRPVQTQDARAIVLSALSVVDLIVFFEEDTPLQLIEALRPQILVKGADYTLSEVIGADFVLAAGGRVFLEDLFPGQSTTSMIARAKD